MFVFGDISTLWKRSEKRERQNLLKAAGVFFLTLFSYPFLRASTTSLFLTNFGAKNSPVVWLYSVIALTIAVWCYNKYQVRFSIHKLFLVTCIFSLAVFTIGLWFEVGGSSWLSYLLYVWKEVYIVLLIHMIFGYTNSAVSLEMAKIVYGPFGAIGSIGGVFGGLCVSWMTYSVSTEVVLVVGALLILFAGILFLSTDRSYCLSKMVDDKSKQLSPIQSVSNIKAYVFFLISIIVLSQFVINLGNFKFNILFETIVLEKDLKTRYLGMMFSFINGLSFLIQVLIIPVIYKYFHLRTVHITIPLAYLAFSIFGLGVYSDFLIPVAASFIFLKGVDYSLFSTSKELLYFPLNAFQKYGAKYLGDMISYRAAKGIISIILIYWQSSFAVSIMLYCFLAIWIVVLFPLFKLKPDNQKNIPEVL